MDFYAAVGMQFEHIDPEDAALVFARDASALGTVVIDPNLAKEARRVRNLSIGSLYDALLRDVPFVLAAEVRHIYDEGKLKPSRSKFFSNNFGPLGTKWFFVYDAIYRHAGTGLDCEPVAPDSPLDRQHPGYLQSYIAAMTASRETGLPFEDVAVAVFDKSAGAQWHGQFGGAPWLEIARAFKALIEAPGEAGVISAVDHIVSLEHNTSTLFTKCAHWAISGRFEWIKDMLDVKFSASSPLAFLGLCTETVRETYLAVEKSRLPYTGERRAITDEYKPVPPNWGPVASVGEGDILTLRYGGAERAFKVHAVLDWDDDFYSFLLGSEGWADHKGVGPGGEPVVISTFAMTAEEVVERFVSLQEASAMEKARRVASKFCSDLHGLLTGIIAMDKPMLSMGSVQVSGPASVALRFRIKGPKGSNFRIYILFTAEEVSVRWSTAKHASNDPTKEELFEDIPIAQVSEADFLNDFGRRLLGKAVEALATSE